MPDAGSGSLAAVPLSIDALNSSLGGSQRGGGGSGLSQSVSGFFSLGDLENASKSEKRSEENKDLSSSQENGDLDSEMFSEDNSESLEKSGQLSVALFSLDEEEEDAQSGGEMVDNSLTTPAA